MNKILRRKRCFKFFPPVILTLISVFHLSGQGLPSKMVGPDWLAANLNREDIRVVDMRLDIRDYWQSHIPGAVYLEAAALRWPERGVPVKVLPPEALAQLLGWMGIKENTSVVVYSEKNGYIPFYLLWALDYLGHKSFAVLEDGFDRWRREGRQLTQDYPKISPVSYKVPAKLNHEARVTLEDLTKEMKAGSVLIDVRQADLFGGEKGPWKRKGRIKGSINHFWAMDLNEDGTWKSGEELLRSYEKGGAAPDKTVIVTCGQGIMAAHTYFTLKYLLDFPKVRLYDGSFSEWSNVDGLPVETGIK